MTSPSKGVVAVRGARSNEGFATKSWASLEDGTPLVTGEHRGKGIVGLLHVSADMRWSDLPMSGTFVEMLRRIVDMSGWLVVIGICTHLDCIPIAHEVLFRSSSQP